MVGDFGKELSKTESRTCHFSSTKTGAVSKCGNTTQRRYFATTLDVFLLACLTSVLAS